MLNPNEVMDFWLNEIGPSGWYSVDAAVDAEIRKRFLPAWEAMRDGGLADWRLRPDSMLAYLVLADQFPRNMFRNSGAAFATDKMARCAAKKAIEKKWDLKVAEPQRQFFYLPLMHSECLADQERCLCLIKTRMPETGDAQMLHAKAHRHVIRQFGRFPYRNAVLERRDTEPEVSFLKQGGYSLAVEAVQA